VIAIVIINYHAVVARYPQRGDAVAVGDAFG
jgi:hypothetical protein